MHANVYKNLKTFFFALIVAVVSVTTLNVLSGQQVLAADTYEWRLDDSGDPAIYRNNTELFEHHPTAANNMFLYRPNPDGNSCRYITVDKDSPSEGTYMNRGTLQTNSGVTICNPGQGPAGVSITITDPNNVLDDDFETQLANSNSGQAGTAGDGNPQNCKGGTGLSAPLGWLLCPLAGAALELVDFVEQQVIEPFLRVSPLQAEDGDILFDVWQGFRNLANIFFVIAFMIIIFSQALSINIDAYTIKRVVPRLLAAMIAIQFSFYIVSFLVDIFNILGEGVRQLILAPLPADAASVTISGIGGVMGGILAGIGGAAFLTSGIATIVAFFLGVALLFLAIIFTLSIRQILIMLLAVTAPIAIATWILPNTESIYKTWQSWLVRALAMYPIIVAIFAAGRLAGAVAGGGAGSNPGAFTSMLTLIASVAPLFLIPFSFKFAGGALTTIMTGLHRAEKGLAGKARDPKDTFMQGLNDRDAQYRERRNRIRNEQAQGLRPMTGPRPLRNIRRTLQRDAFGIGTAARASEHLKFVSGLDEADKNLDKLAPSPFAQKEFLAHGQTRETLMGRVNELQAQGSYDLASQLARLENHAGSPTIAGAALKKIATTGNHNFNDIQNAASFYDQTTDAGTLQAQEAITSAAFEGRKARPDIWGDVSPVGIESTVRGISPKDWGEVRPDAFQNPQFQQAIRNMTAIDPNTNTPADPVGRGIIEEILAPGSGLGVNTREAFRVTLGDNSYQDLREAGMKRMKEGGQQTPPGTSYTYNPDDPDNGNTTSS